MRERKDVVQEYWKSYLGYTDKQINTIGFTVLPIPVADAERSEIRLTEWKNGGTIISVPPQFYASVSDMITNNPGDIESALRKIMGDCKKYGPIITSSLSDTPVFLELSQAVKKLSHEDKAMYDEFMDLCDEKDKNLVDMNFDDSFHVFFAVVVDGKIQSLGNYSREKKLDQIAHIGIITLSIAKGKGYAKAVINTLLHDALEHGFAPQWRAHFNNIPSQKLAEKFGFEEIMRSYSLVTVFEQEK